MVMNTNNYKSSESLIFCFSYYDVYRSEECLSLQQFAGISIQSQDFRQSTPT